MIMSNERDPIQQNNYRWNKKQYDRLPEYVQKIRKILNDWFYAIEDGSVRHKFPDTTYPTNITHEIADEVIKNLDEQFDREKYWAIDTCGYDSGPDFYRLEPQQRIAMCQEIHKALKESPKPETYGNYYDLY